MLLTPDPAAPFGVKLDADRVVDAFDKAWDKGDERGVVLVEASDLARLRRYMRFTTAEQFVSLRTTALRDADAMFGRLLEQVDPDRDAVMVVGPSEGRRKLTVTALRTPGSSPGYIRTASSQHDGVAIAVDVGPTLLDLFGIDFTDKMEGRPYEIVPSNASLAARSDQFIEEAQGSARRGERLAPMTAILVGLIAIVALAHGARRRGGRERVAPPPQRARVGRAVLAGDAAEHAARPVDTRWHRGLRRLPPGRGRIGRGHRDGRVVPAPTVRSDDRHARVHARRDPRRRHDRFPHALQRGVRLLADRELAPLRHLQLLLRRRPDVDDPPRDLHHRVRAHPLRLRARDGADGLRPRRRRAAGLGLRRRWCARRCPDLPAVRVARAATEDPRAHARARRRS